MNCHAPRTLLHALFSMGRLRTAPTPPPRPQAPAYHGCLDESAKKLPYCNTSLSREKRLDDLLSRTR